MRLGSYTADAQAHRASPGPAQSSQPRPDFADPAADEAKRTFRDRRGRDERISSDPDAPSTLEALAADVFSPGPAYPNRTAREYAGYRRKIDDLAARAEREGKQLYEMDGWGEIAIDITHYLWQSDLADDARTFLAGLQRDWHRWHAQNRQRQHRSRSRGIGI